MEINGKEVTFRMNIRAAKRIAALCPGRDLTKIDTLFAQDDLVKFLENLTEIAIAMSMNSSNDTPLTAEEVEELDITDMNNIAQELRNNFVRDRETVVETTPTKKNEVKDSEESKSD